MKLRLALLLASSVAFAQNKTNLGTQVQGQLPVANAQPVMTAAHADAVTTATTVATPLANTAQATSSSFSRNGATIYRGAHAHNGYMETFSSDGRCVPGTSSARDFEYTSSGLDCSLPGFYHAASGTFNLERVLANGSFPAPGGSQPNQLYPVYANVFGLSFTAPLGGYYGTGNNAYVGFDTCAKGQYACGLGSEIGIQVTQQGVYLQDAGTTTLLWDVSNNASGNGGANTTTSSPGYGWGAPQQGYSYSYSLILPGDGSAIVSAIPTGGTFHAASGTAFYIARVPITMPSGGVRDLFIRGGTNDYISDIAEADSAMPQGSLGTPLYPIAAAITRHSPIALRWALHQNGTECNYAAMAADCTSVYAMIPPNYNPDAPNPWDLILRGQEVSILNFVGTIYPLVNYLFVNGHVQIWGDWHGGLWYGSPNKIQDIASAIHIARDSLSLAQRPYVYADSAGGINAFNAITHGILRPQIMFCFSCNLSMAWDISNGQGGFIQTDFGTTAAQFTAATAGYDPVGVLTNPLTAQGPLTGATFNLLPNAALAASSFPSLFITDSEGGDGTVDPNSNSVAAANAINALNPGAATLLYIGGGHVSSNKFDPTIILPFIEANP